MVLDVQEPPSASTISDDDEEDTLDLELPGANNKHKGLRTLHISHLLQMVLQDAQTRLFFKAQSVVQSEIRYYVPKPEDLAYPDKLVGMCFWFFVSPFRQKAHRYLAARKPTTGYEFKEKESISQIFQLKSLDKQDTWYPTLSKTVWVLSQLHDFVKVRTPGMSHPIILTHSASPRSSTTSPKRLSISVANRLS